MAKIWQKRSGSLHLVYDSGSSSTDTISLEARVKALEDNAEQVVAFSWGENGYVLYKSGLLIQWGTSNLNDDGTGSNLPTHKATVTLKKPYKSATSYQISATYDSNTSGASYALAVDPLTGSTFRACGVPWYFHWITVGQSA